MLQFTYSYWPIDYNTLVTYSQNQRSGVAGVAGRRRIYTPASETQVITVRNIYLAYYDSISPQTYLQPVFVFEGDGGFIAYVPAINPEFIESDYDGGANVCD